MCGVDAIQFLTDCTLGKGNFMHRDYGKMAFSFFDRKTGEGFRAVLNPAAWGEIGREMGELTSLDAAGKGTPEMRKRIMDLRQQMQDRLHGPGAGRPVRGHPVDTAARRGPPASWKALSARGAARRSWSRAPGVWAARLTAFRASSSRSRRSSYRVRLSPYSSR